jgi:hypothetical protein
MSTSRTVQLSAKPDLSVPGNPEKMITAVQYAPALRAAWNWWELVLLDTSFVRPSDRRSTLLLLSRCTAPIWIAADTQSAPFLNRSSIRIYSGRLFVCCCFAKFCSSPIYLESGRYARLEKPAPRTARLPANGKAGNWHLCECGRQTR